jgi:hypothetical protein
LNSTTLSKGSRATDTVTLGVGWWEVGLRVKGLRFRV